jgi:SAM-dependent methyltransferase
VTVDPVDRQRASLFGIEAERYERARPTYPAALVDRLLAERTRQVLDIGCGTGKAGRLFAERGCTVLGVESDERMAAVARERGLGVETARFEEWNPSGRIFDLGICGQAWHWLDPERRLEQVAAALRPAGRFAAFWNFPHFEEGGLDGEIDDLYESLAPELRAGRLGVGAREADRAADLDQLAESALFTGAEEWIFRHQQSYRRDELLDLLQTYSDHIALPAERRARLLEAIGVAVDAHGGSRVIAYRTVVVTALRA